MNRDSKIASLTHQLILLLLGTDEFRETKKVTYPNMKNMFDVDSLANRISGVLKSVCIDQRISIEFNLTLREVDKASLDFEKALNEAQELYLAEEMDKVHIELLPPISPGMKHLQTQLQLGNLTTVEYMKKVLGYEEE